MLGRRLARPAARDRRGPGLGRERRAPTVLCYGHFDVQPPGRSSSGRATRSSRSSATDTSTAAAPSTTRASCTCSSGRAGARAGGRAAGERPLLLRRRGGDRRAPDRRVPRGGRARRRRGAHLRQRHDPVRPAGLQPRRAGSVLPRRRPDRRARPPLGDLRRGGAQRRACARAGDLALVARDGRLPEPLRRGSSRRPRRSCAAGRSCRRAPTSSRRRVRAVDPRAAEEFYLRTFAEPSLDVNGFEGGSPHLQKTVLPVEAEANLSIRLAPGQDVEEIAAEVERLLREAAPDGRRARDRALSSAPPGSSRPTRPR